MSYRVFYACDINGCRNDHRLDGVDGPVANKLPDGWIALYRSGRENRPFYDVPLFICPEHAELFPASVKPVPPPVVGMK